VRQERSTPRATRYGYGPSDIYNFTLHPSYSVSVVVWCMTSSAHPLLLSEDRSVMSDTYLSTAASTGQKPKVFNYNNDAASNKKLAKDTTTETASNKLAKANNTIQELTTVMQNNITSTIERGEKLEDLELGALRLEEEARRFHKNSRTLKCEMYKKKAKVVTLIMVILAIVIVVVYFAFASKS
jgi:hypothetical protein